MPKIKRSRAGTDKKDRITLRVSGRDKFALELLARKKKTTLSALVLELCEPAPKEELTTPNRKEKIYIPVAAYNPLAPDRLVKLAQVAPDLLDDREQVLWTAIQENSDYWDGDEPKFTMIRELWDYIEKEADNLTSLHGKRFQ